MIEELFPGHKKALLISDGGSDMIGSG